MTDQCKVIAKQDISPPSGDLLLPMSTPVKYTAEQVSKGISRSEVVENQAENNRLWSKDRYQLKGLQQYIIKLQEANIIGK